MATGIGGTAAALGGHDLVSLIEHFGWGPVATFFTLQHSALANLAAKAGQKTATGIGKAAQRVPPALLGGLVGEGVRSKDE